MRFTAAALGFEAQALDGRLERRARVWIGEVFFLQSDGVPKH